jgi:hypothetical protein
MGSKGWIQGEAAGPVRHRFVRVSIDGRGAGLEHAARARARGGDGVSGPPLAPAVARGHDARWEADAVIAATGPERTMLVADGVRNPPSSRSESMSMRMGSGNPSSSRSELMSMRI